MVPSDGNAGPMTASVPGARVTDRGAGLLRDRDRRLLLAGQAASELGSQVGGIALPLVAVLGLGAGPLQVGPLTAAGALSFAVPALPAGCGWTGWPAGRCWSAPTWSAGWPC